VAGGCSHVCYKKRQHQIADNRGPNGCPARNIGNQRAKIPPDVPVPFRAAVGGGITPFLLFVVARILPLTQKE